MSNTYWNNKGKYLSDAEMLSGHVPAVGKCDTLKGELFRAGCQIYYDLYNNGFGNNWKNMAMFLLDNIEFDNGVKSALYMHGDGIVKSKEDDCWLYDAVERMLDNIIEHARKIDDDVLCLEDSLKYFSNHHHIFFQSADQYYDDCYEDEYEYEADYYLL